MGLRDLILGILASSIVVILERTGNMGIALAIGVIYFIYIPFVFYERFYEYRLKYKQLPGLWVGEYIHTGSTDGKKSYSHKRSSVNLCLKLESAGKFLILQNQFGNSGAEAYCKGYIDKDLLIWEYMKPNNRVKAEAKLVGKQLQGTFESIWNNGDTKYWGEFSLTKTDSDVDLKEIFK